MQHYYNYCSKNLSLHKLICSQHSNNLKIVRVLW